MLKCYISLLSVHISTMTLCVKSSLWINLHPPALTGQLTAATAIKGKKKSIFIWKKIWFRFLLLRHSLLKCNLRAACPQNASWSARLHWHSLPWPKVCNYVFTAEEENVIPRLKFFTWCARVLNPRSNKLCNPQSCLLSGANTHFAETAASDLGRQTRVLIKFRVVYAKALVAHHTFWEIKLECIGNEEKMV